MNAADHIITMRPTSIAMIPIIRKLGIIVKAGSVPCIQSLCAVPIASITLPLVMLFPWRISNKPCSIPPIPATIPIPEETILNALVFIILTEIK